MFPYINIFGRIITLYAIMAITGILIAGAFMCRLTRKRGLDDNDTIVVLLISAIGVLIGSHLLYGITNIKLLPQIFNAESFKAFVIAAINVFGGAVFYGGLFGGLIAGYITVKINKWNLSVFSDMAAPTIPLFHAFARVGCFFGGCCYGIESKFGFTAHNNKLIEEVNGISRFPVQLLESFLNILLFLLIYKLYKKSLNKPLLKGKLMLIYLNIYSVIRFFDEFLRGDKIRGFIFGISTSQFISILVFVVSLTRLLLLFRRIPGIKPTSE